MSLNIGIKQGIVFWLPWNNRTQTGGRKQQFFFWKVPVKLGAIYSTHHTKSESSGFEDLRGRKPASVKTFIVLGIFGLSHIGCEKFSINFSPKSSSSKKLRTVILTKKLNPVVLKRNEFQHQAKTKFLTVSACGYHRTRCSSQERPGVFCCFWFLRKQNSNRNWYRRKETKVRHSYSRWTNWGMIHRFFGFYLA